jgi:hypothetical protein
MRFLFPPGAAVLSTPKHPVSLAGAIAPATAPRRDQDQPGAQSPRPAPAPPPAGASHLPGRALASASSGPAGLQGTVAHGRGKRDAFPVPARRGEGTSTASIAVAIAPATAPRRDQDQPGPKAPGQRPPRPRRALRPRRVGRWPLCLPDVPIYGAPSRAGGGNAVRFLFPPGAAVLSTPKHAVSLAGAIAPATAPRWHQDRPGAQSPLPAPAPPPAGASRPPGRALASVSPGPAGLQGTVPRGRGKRDAFPVPARTGEGTFTASKAGAIAPATALRRDQDRPGAKAPGQRPPRPRRAPAFVARAKGPVRLWPPTGRGNALPFRVRPQGKTPLRRISRIFPSGTQRGCSSGTLSGTVPARMFATGSGRQR